MKDTPPHKTLQEIICHSCVSLFDRLRRISAELRFINKYRHVGKHVIKIFDDGMMDRLNGLYKISDAACGGDILLYKLLHTVEHGFYIDIGCGDPITSSLTNLFYQAGWNGINIDAQSEEIEKYASVRTRDINICAALSDKDDEELVLFCYGELTSLNRENVERLGKDGFDMFSERHIYTKTLNSLLRNQTLPPEIHFLKVDVEAHEKEVLSGIDFQQYRPWLVVMEATLPNTEIPTQDDWEEILITNDYSFFIQQSVNRYYLAGEKRDLLVNNFFNKPVVPFMERVEYSRILRVYELMSCPERKH
jgi:FkbM family methyltransferase